MEHVRIHEDGIREAGIYTPALSIDAEGGRIVAYVGSDTDNYSEVFVEFHTDDGRILQLAVAGQRHSGDGDEGMHCAVWNGIDEDAEHDHEIAVNDAESHWHDMNGKW